jgi:zinc transport system permease protein
VIVIAVLGVLVLAAMLVFRPALFAISNDEEYARVSGLPVRTLNLLMAVTTAVTVTIAMRTVGLLLVSALMVVPVAAAQQITRGFRATMTVAMLIGVCAAASGVAVSAEIDTAPGATIVILALVVFVVLAVVKAAGSRGRHGRAEQSDAVQPPEHRIAVRWPQ